MIWRIVLERILQLILIIRLTVCKTCRENENMECWVLGNFAWILRKEFIWHEFRERTFVYSNVSLTQIPRHLQLGCSATHGKQIQCPEANSWQNEKRKKFLLFTCCSSFAFGTMTRILTIFIFSGYWLLRTGVGFFLSRNGLRAPEMTCRIFILVRSD
jgi:hypothetical protein